MKKSNETRLLFCKIYMIIGAFVFLFAVGGYLFFLARLPEIYTIRIIYAFGALMGAAMFGRYFIIFRRLSHEKR